MTEPKDYGFTTTSTARTVATEAAVKASEVKAASAQDDVSDEIIEESAPSKQNDSDDDLDDVSNDSDDTDDSQGEDHKPKKNNLKKRFAKLTQAKKTAEQRAIQLETELAQLRQGKGNNPTEVKQPAKTTVVEEGKPDPKDFDTHVEYLDAYHNWRDEQREKKATKAAEEKQRNERADNIQKSYDEKVKEFSKTNTDFQEKIDEVIHLVHSQNFLEAVVSSEFGPQIAYELANNPKEIERLQSIDAGSMYREIGRLEAKFLSAQEKSLEAKAVKSSSAPRPISPVGGSSSSTSKALNDPNISFAEYERERLKQLNKK